MVRWISYGRNWCVLPRGMLWIICGELSEKIPKSAAQSVIWEKIPSDNAIIRSFIDFAGNSITDKMETLLSGRYILQDIDENLTYDYLHSSESNLWSILYMTGYLTEARISEGKTAFSPDTKALKIPNAEIREIFWNYGNEVVCWQCEKSGIEQRFFPGSLGIKKSQKL